MKTKKNEPKALSNSPNPKGRILRKATLVYTEEDAENAKKAMAEFLAKWGQKPVGGRMVLTNEIGIKLINPIWLEVDGSIRELDPGHFNSFACLSTRGNNFIQCLRGFNGYHLEWRITNPSGNYVHYRACYLGGSKKSFELKKHNHVSDGQHRDLLNLDDVLDAFRAFHRGEGLPGFLKWRKLYI
jgi:hypothetical protein